jgi:hypothetical protein
MESIKSENPKKIKNRKHPKKQKSENPKKTENHKNLNKNTLLAYHTLP